MRKFSTAVVAGVALAAALAISVPAQAASVSTLGSGVLVHSDPVAAGLGGGLADFNGIPSNTPYGQSAPAQGPFSQGGASFSGDGILMTNVGLDPLGLYAQPAGTTTQYLTIRPFVSSPSGVATETVTFGGNAYSTLGLFWGSMDTYNSIQFYRNGTLIDTVTGSDAAAAIVPPAAATGNQVSDSNNRYVVIGNLLGGGLFDAIILTSRSNSFELDNLAWGNLPPENAVGAAVPVPGALPLFASGLGLLGLLARRRKRTAA